MVGVCAMCRKSFIARLPSVTFKGPLNQMEMDRDEWNLCAHWSVYSHHKCVCASGCVSSNAPGSRSKILKRQGGLKSTKPVFLLRKTTAKRPNKENPGDVASDKQNPDSVGVGGIARRVCTLLRSSLLYFPTCTCTTSCHCNNSLLFSEPPVPPPPEVKQEKLGGSSPPLCS